MTGHHTRIATGIDHVIVEALDNRAVYRFFTEVLALPSAWPLAQWGEIHEAGVNLGSCNIGCNHQPAGNDSAPTVRMIALEPAHPIPVVIDMLSERGLVPTEALVSGVIEHLPDEEPFKPWRQGFTNVGVFGDGLDTLPFICAYDHDVEERHRSQLAQLESSGGGVLGITGLTAVILHTDDVAALGASWECLLGSQARVATDRLTPNRGPELHLATGDAPPALVLGVHSASDAATALHEVGINSHQQGEVLKLDPADTVGLDIRLIESQRR
jgi:hypothetical protein